MPTRPLPQEPSLEHLRKQAKRLRKSVSAGDADALALVKEFHPRAEPALALFSLADAQLVTARSYDFSTWTALKQHLVAIAPFVWNPPPLPTGAPSHVDAFIRLACLIYGDWNRANPEKARRLLEDHPETSRANIYTAAAAGDATTVGAMIEREPALLNAKGGSLNWEPLLYACYSRMDGLLPQCSTLDVARLLLERGADPNAGFLWGASYTFTALTGAFGEGEDGTNQPPHPHCFELATLLLEAGADPNDTQTLYNRHFRENDEHLTLLLSYGLGKGPGGPWYKRLGDKAWSPARLLVEELWSAAKNKRPERVKLLIERGVDVNVPGLRTGRTPYEEALRAGNLSMAEYLLEHGARKIALDPIETFAVACITGQREAARAELVKNPDLLQTLGPKGQADLLHRAFDAGQRDGIRLLVELGVNLNEMVPGTAFDRTVLHNAAGWGGLEMVRFLLGLGADPYVRDLTYGGTPIAWARHNQQREVIAFLLPTATLLDAVQCDGVERVEQVLRQDSASAHVTDPSGFGAAFYLHPELTRLEEMLHVLVAYGVDLHVRDKAGMTLLDRAVARGWTDFAVKLRAFVRGG